VRGEIDAFLLPAGPGRQGERFCLHHAPAEGRRPWAALVYLHPFAEEMNKSRRMAAWQARSFAEQGVAVLQIDLLGCGDSSGDSTDAGWDDWVSDALLAHRWLAERHDLVPGFWGLRAGCLLATEAARRLHQALDFVFWQPASSGKAQWSQFQRLKSIGDKLAGTQATSRQGDADGPPEIAGYRFPPTLSDGLAKADMKPPAMASRGLWIEISTSEGDELSPAMRMALEAWKPVHRRLDALKVPGPPFWQTQEIEDAPDLVSATTAAVQAWQAA
jgi:uncharacterized protein